MPDGHWIFHSDGQWLAGPISSRALQWAFDLSSTPHAASEYLQVRFARVPPICQTAWHSIRRTKSGLASRRPASRPRRGSRLRRRQAGRTAREHRPAVSERDDRCAHGTAIAVESGGAGVVLVEDGLLHVREGLPAAERPVRRSEGGLRECRPVEVLVGVVPREVGGHRAPRPVGQTRLFSTHRFVDGQPSRTGESISQAYLSGWLKSRVHEPSTPAAPSRSPAWRRDR
jgi:hypothetical protein